jgi:hypothetical protein
MSRTAFRIATAAICASIGASVLLLGSSPTANAKGLVAQEAETTEGSSAPRITKFAKIKIGKRSAVRVAGDGSFQLAIGGPKATVWISRLNGATEVDYQKLQAVGLRLESFAFTTKRPDCASLMSFLAADYPGLPGPKEPFGFASYGFERKGCSWKLPESENDSVTIEVSKPTDFAKFLKILSKIKSPYFVEER